MGLIASLKAYLAERLDVHLTSNRHSKKHELNNKIKAKGKATVNQNVVVLNIAGASKQEKEKALDLLADTFGKGDIVFMDDESKRLADSVAAAESRDSEGDLVKFFKDKLKTQDWQILRTGLYIEFLVSQGINTRGVREGVIRNHGTRGKNLLNLAAAGHFESHIKPLYEELSKSKGFNKAVFYEEFDRILQEMPFAIFVNNTMGVDGLKETVEAKMRAARTYSVDERRIYVHAWGPNTHTVEACLSEIETKHKITINKRVEGVAIIDATIEF